MSKRKGPFTVVVGNIGAVGIYNNYMQACKCYGEYKRLSHDDVGRAGGERVTLCDVDGNPVLEYQGADGE